MTTKGFQSAPLDRRDPNWVRIRNIFLEAGFDREEASHAANTGLDPEPEEPDKHPVQVRMVKWLLNNRRRNVDTLIKYGGFTWAEAVASQSETATQRRQEKGLEDLDLFGGET